ncbi:MAG: DUF835 domain-containing protein [Thermoplasmata archaeon]
MKTKVKPFEERTIDPAITERKEAEEALQKRTYDLGERVKELNCLYGISDLVEKPGISLDEIFQGTADLIPFSWQYPEVTCARIIFEGQEYKTKNFKKTRWKQPSNIRVYDNKSGAVEVYYLEKKSASDEGPFLKEERSLINAIAERLGKITERKNAEEKLRLNKQMLDHMAEGVTLIRSDNGIIIYTNPAFNKMFGYGPGEMVGKHVSVVNAPTDKSPEETANKIMSILNESRELVIELENIRKDGTLFWTQATVSAFEHSIHGSLLVTVQEDITERKRTEEEMKRQLMKYKLEEGSLYMVKEPIPSLSYGAFNDLLKVGHPGFVISRTPEEKFKKDFEGDVEFVWISGSGGEEALPPDLSKIELRIKALARKSGVLIDRLDYLVFRNGFEDTLSFIQRLKDLAYLAGHVVIVSIDPSTISKRELRLLEKEAEEVKPMHKVELTENLLVTIRFIYEQNIKSLKPSYKDVALKFDVSRPTVRKRIKQLVSSGYLGEIAKGNRKVLELTEKGKILLLE